MIYLNNLNSGHVEGFFRLRNYYSLLQVRCRRERVTWNLIEKNYSNFRVRWVNPTVDGWNPANHQGWWLFTIIYRVSAPSQVVVWDFSHQQYCGDLRIVQPFRSAAPRDLKKLVGLGAFHWIRNLNGCSFFTETWKTYGCWTKNRGILPPKWMVKIMDNSIKMDDLGVPLFFGNIHMKTWRNSFGGRTIRYLPNFQTGCFSSY